MIFDWLLRRRYDMAHFLCYRPTVAVFLSDSSDAHSPECALITALVQMVSHHIFKKNKTNHGIKSNKKIICALMQLSLSLLNVLVSLMSTLRPQYFKIIEECVSQIVLHRSGTDPDFSYRKRLDVDFSHLLGKSCRLL